MGEREAIETVQHKGYTIAVYSDDDPVDPCQDFDMLGKMVCWHRRYNLGHDQPAERPEDWIQSQLSNPEAHENDNLEALVAAWAEDNVVMPLYLYDHSGITISTGHGYPYNDQWDAGQVGFIFVSKAKVREEYSAKRITNKLLAKVRNVLQAEVDTYDDYLTGMVYGYEVTDSDGDFVDSCWGFFGYPEGSKQAMEDGKAVVDAIAKKSKRRAREAVK